MQALSSWVVRHRLIVALVWLAVTVVGVVVAPSVSGRLKSGVNLDSAAYTANQQIARHYGWATAAPGLVTINLPAGQTRQPSRPNSRPWMRGSRRRSPRCAKCPTHPRAAMRWSGTPELAP